MMSKRLLSVLCLLALMAALVPGAAASDGGAAAPIADKNGVAIVGQGWYETLCAELTGTTDEEVAAVKYIDAAGVETALIGEDLAYLVRDMDGGVRVDIPGVKAGAYDLVVTLKNGRDYVVQGLEVEAYDRSGFAHKVHTVDSEGNFTGLEDYTEGVGAYNDDGTLKDNATVLYVTQENKEGVSLTVRNDKGEDFTVTGIGNILNCKGFDQNQKAAGRGAYIKVLSRMASAGRPLVVRIIGEVTKPEGTTTAWSTANGGAKDDGGGMCIMEYAGNVTIEGIGPDATVNGWGFSFNADGSGRTMKKNKRDGWGENIEVRNLTFRNVPEDCVNIMGAQDTKDGFKDSAEHTWVHNNSFYGPKGLPDQSKDKDKSGGDGAVDFRNGEYMTLSYNYFEGYHKTSLVGSADDNLQYHVTWHHNWWKNVQSRSPLARQADMHIYNNLYDGQTSYCMSLRANSYIFSEYNTFLNCKNPVVDEGSGGVCKSYQDVFTNCNAEKPNAAVIVGERSQTVTSSNPYPNFDTDAALSYIPAGDYALQEDAAAAAETVRAKAGVQKREMSLPGSGAAEYGQLGTAQWFYNADGEVVIFGDVPEEDVILVAGYNAHGRCIRVGLVKAGKAALGTGVDMGKLFWLGGDRTPKCEAESWGEG